ncbi:tRNA(Ile)-lysidine synthase [Spatholobus suberectus]|nr:tRNA(Ile)-lysidine synthase [Spatholobus suberectus]
MARGLILSSPTLTATTCLLAPFSKTPPKRFNLSLGFRLLSSACCFSVSSSPSQCSIDMSKYTEAFSRRMAMAGLKPHHRIALGVSGGPDSMALCVLTAGWKTAGANTFTTENGGFIDGLLAIIVDHGLRAESKEEANLVSHRVAKMGIRCEIACCDWPSGRPKRGQLQEAAREMRYQIFHEVCAQHRIGVLLIAHHADDQAELFILRLSRNSGVLGLAGMPFTSQIFPIYTHSNREFQANQGILLVRPLLEFSKEDMYKICQGGNEDWVEDPTNQSPLYARNRIRMVLNNLSSTAFKSELQAMISACRITRTYVDQIGYSLIREAVVIMDHGYAVIDLQILCPLKIEDICLMKFLSLVLQFVSQRQRQIRGSALKLLMDYIRSFPCKNSITAAGCYLCPDPGSKGSRVLVCCCSDDCALPLKMEFFEPHSYKQRGHCVADELKKIIEDKNSYANHLVPDASDVHFLDVNPELVLTEAKRLNIISESTYNSILMLQKQETTRFRSKTEAISDSGSKRGVEIVTPIGKSLLPGKFCYFMDRFILTWKLNNKIDKDALSDLVDHDMDLSEEGRSFCCTSCVHNKVPEVRHMIESDWLYLAELSKYPLSKILPQHEVISVNGTKQIMDRAAPGLYCASVSAKQALRLLKSIPVAARRSLPVLINQQGQLLSIPSVNFKHCPCLMVHVEFKPKMPLGGGHTLFI